MDFRPALDRLSEFFGRNRRSAPRYAVLLSAQVVTAAGALPVTLRDISPVGAQVQSKSLPPVNSVVILKRGALEVAARLAWKDLDRGGLTFETPITTDNLLDQIRRPQRELPRKAIATA